MPLLPQTILSIIQPDINERDLSFVSARARAARTSLHFPGGVA